MYVMPCVCLLINCYCEVVYTFQESKLKLAKIQLLHYGVICQSVVIVMCAGQSPLKWHCCNVKRQLPSSFHQNFRTSDVHYVQSTNTHTPILIKHI